MINIPDKLHLANLPTKIEYLERLSKELNVNLYVKRDDQTGTEYSGNKVRKLEYIIKAAIDENCDYLITCGGIQSNHARATAALASKLGLKSYLVLRSSNNEQVEGNYFLSKLLGAQIELISPSDYKHHRMEIMKRIKDDLATQSHKAFIIPEGGSMGIGVFGYYSALEEITLQEQEMKMNFDAIVLAVGSGGTYAGMFLANILQKRKSIIYGINVCDSAEYFKKQINKVLIETKSYLNENFEYTIDDIKIIDGYVGKGYAKSTNEELEFIHYLAKLEGLILDPVYTGKAMYGLVKEIKKGSFNQHKNILFIHTGGLFGLFPSSNLFNL